jgi:hypothetical protein
LLSTGAILRARPHLVQHKEYKRKIERFDVDKARGKLILIYVRNGFVPILGVHHFARR